MYRKASSSTWRSTSSTSPPLRSACVLLPSPDIVAAGPWVFAIPSDPSIVGTAFYMQGLHAHLPAPQVGPCTWPLDFALGDGYRIVVTP